MSMEKNYINCKCAVFATVFIIVLTSLCETDLYDQARLESFLARPMRICLVDNENGPEVPLRNRDGMLRYSGFMDRSGWSTNQVISGLMLAMTNYLSETDWADERKRRIAEVAAWHLSEINQPAVTNFFRWFNDTDNTSRMKLSTIPPMFRYTNLEPEVLGYMRTLCVRTNIYDKVALGVMYQMIDALESMPSELKTAATNRVARYMYFAIRNVTDSQGAQDVKLAGFIPAYSNSVQRLDLMRYVSTSATNSWERANASNVVERLSSMPSNQLNNVGWIAE